MRTGGNVFGRGPTHEAGALLWGSICMALAVAAGLAPSAAPAQAPTAAKKTDEEPAVRAASDAYSEAFSKGDVDAFLTLWTADAEYIDPEGRVIRGKANLAAFFKEQFADLKGHALAVNIGALRFFRPDLAVEDGTATLTAPDGSTTGGRYNAVWVKSDGGKWQVARVQDLPSDAENEASGHTHLKPLSWLVGEWTASKGNTGLSADLTVRWQKNENFLSVEQTEKLKGELTLSISRMIGWDGSVGQIRSWSFDSLGGHSEGSWTHDDHTWTIKTKGVLADGSKATSVISLDWIDDNTFVLRTKSRTIDEQPVASDEQKFVRKTK